MKFIKLRDSNCKNCYKCLKVCMIKSIAINSKGAKVLEDDCVYCGRCLSVCPLTKKLLTNDISNIFDYINDPNIITAVSLDPSFIAVFGNDYPKAAAAIRRLGFNYVEETAIGAEYVTMEYKRLVEEYKMESIITTSCPSINKLVTKYFPDLTKYLAPVITPTVAHAKILKEKYGRDTKVIYLGPCLSQIKEAEENQQYIDGAMTFAQLMDLFPENNINFDELEEEEFDTQSSYSRIYPIRDGILFDIKEKLEYDNTRRLGYRGNYISLSVSGLHELSNLFGEMQSGELTNVIIEANACRGGCINCSMKPGVEFSGYKDRIKVREYANKVVKKEKVTPYFDMSKEFKPNKSEDIMPTEDDIRKILANIGKYSKEQELNCESCGYSTCREKAIAVYQGKADPHMCMSYMADLGQTLSSTVLSVTPNYIIAVDRNFKIKEFNVAAQKLFKISRNDALNKDISSFMGTENIEQVFKTQKSITNKKVEYKHLGIVTSQTIVYSHKENIAILVIKDITSEENRRKLAYKTKIESVEMAQRVIDKQMTVAQEIASLLGETTAETKVTLSKLKNLIDTEEGADNG